MNTEAAKKAGKKAAKQGFARVSPYYEVKENVDGRRVDVTGQLTKAWLEGYDG